MKCLLLLLIGLATSDPIPASKVTLPHRPDFQNLEVSQLVSDKEVELHEREAREAFESLVPLLTPLTPLTFEDFELLVEETVSLTLRNLLHTIRTSADFRTRFKKCQGNQICHKLYGRNSWLDFDSLGCKKLNKMEKLLGFSPRKGYVCDAEMELSEFALNRRAYNNGSDV